MALYTKIFKTKLAYISMAAIASKDKKKVEYAKKEDRVELELIATIANIGKHAQFNSIQASLDENLSKDFLKVALIFFKILGQLKLDLMKKKSSPKWTIYNIIS